MKTWKVLKIVSIWGYSLICSAFMIATWYVFGWAVIYGINRPHLLIYFNVATAVLGFGFWILASIGTMEDSTKPEKDEHYEKIQIAGLFSVFLCVFIISFLDNSLLAKFLRIFSFPVVIAMVLDYLRLIAIKKTCIVNC